MILAIKLAGAGEEHSTSRHVYAHGKCLCSKQRLGLRIKKKQTTQHKHNINVVFLQLSFSIQSAKLPCRVFTQIYVCIEGFSLEGIAWILEA